jgi:SAM-dependent methyltransferase
LQKNQTMISDQDLKKIIARYQDRFEQYGLDIRTLNAGKGNKLHLQHTVHASIGDLHNKTILDIGCGLASYYEFLKSRGLKVNYIGYDIVEPFIAVNVERFPEAQFEVRDVSRDGVAHRADYAVMCQVFNNKYASVSNDEVVKNAIAQAFAAVSTAVSIDLRTNYVNYREADTHYFSPEEMFAFAKTLTPFVKLRHDYLPFDFTLMLYKEGTMLWE